MNDSSPLNPQPPAHHKHQPEAAEKWTEIEHLPAWDEEFYDIYTAKKHGKWVMLKTLKAAYKEDPRFQAMIEKEFDVRYNLAHSNIVMINDFDFIPGVGWSIITDDVYGLSLRKLLDDHKVTDHHLQQVTHQLVDAIDYIQTNHLVHFPIRPETIIFTENIENLKLIDVGFDQRESLTPADAAEDIQRFGEVLTAILDELPDSPPRLRRVAERCTDSRRRYKNVHELRMALAGRSDSGILVAIIAFLVVMIGLLVWLRVHQ
ncbi:MAG: protein kinase [Bacteroidales bacterium]|nr:protein kinase [Bacteroidales bacterium]